MTNQDRTKKSPKITSKLGYTILGIVLGVFTMGGTMLYHKRYDTPMTDQWVQRVKSILGDNEKTECLIKKVTEQFPEDAFVQAQINELFQAIIGQAIGQAFEECGIER